MTLAHARALLTACEPHIEPLAASRDRDALRALAHWAMRFTPDVNTDETNGLLLNITGCARVFRGEKRLVHRMADGLERLGFTARLAAAPTIGCAWAFAHYGPQPITLIDDCDAVVDLPIAALRVEDDIVDALAEVGIERIEHLIDLPRRELPSRFGDDLLLRLDQALGRAIETIDPIRPRPPQSMHIAFDGPTKNLEAVMLAVQRLIEQLSHKLQKRESGALQLDLHFERCDAPPVGTTIELSHPSRDVKHLWSLLRPRVENTHLGFGVDEITLTATRDAGLPHEQITSWREQQPTDAAPLIDTLINRLGRDRVTQFDVNETHIPERVFVRRPITDAPRRDAAVTAYPRPSMLFDRPEPADVIALTPDGPPTWLRWRGREHHILTSFGPERVGPAWWQRRKTGTRDYFKVQDDTGRWLWIFRSHTRRRWFVHGRWA